MWALFTASITDKPYFKPTALLTNTISCQIYLHDVNSLFQSSLFIIIFICPVILSLHSFYLVFDFVPNFSTDFLISTAHTASQLACLWTWTWRKGKSSNFIFIFLKQILVLVLPKLLSWFRYIKHNHIHFTIFPWYA